MPEFFKRYGKWILAAVLAAAVLLAIPALAGITAEDILRYTPASPPKAALALLGAYCVKTLLMFIPLVALYISAGLLFSPAKAIAVTYAGLTLELTLGYCIGRRIGGDRLEPLLERRERMRPILRHYRKHQNTVCFWGRMCPIPFDPLNLFLGAMELPYGKYLLLSLLGITPTMIPYVIAGNAVGQPLSREFLIPFGISLGISVVMFVLYQAFSSRSSQ